MTSFAYIFPCPFTLLHLLPTLQPIGRIFAMCNVTLYNYVITPATFNVMMTKKQILIPALTTFTTPGS